MALSVLERQWRVLYNRLFMYGLHRLTIRRLHCRACRQSVSHSRQVARALREGLAHHLTYHAGLGPCVAFTYTGLRMQETITHTLAL